MTDILENPLFVCIQHFYSAHKKCIALFDLEFAFGTIIYDLFRYENDGFVLMCGRIKK